MSEAVRDLLRPEQNPHEAEDLASAASSNYATLAADLDGKQNESIAEPLGDFDVRVRYEPVGVCALIRAAGRRHRR